MVVLATQTPLTLVLNGPHPQANLRDHSVLLTPRPSSFRTHCTRQSIVSYSTFCAWLLSRSASLKRVERPLLERGGGGDAYLHL